MGKWVVSKNWLTMMGHTDWVTFNFDSFADAINKFSDLLKENNFDESEIEKVAKNHFEVCREGRLWIDIQENKEQ